MKKAKIIFLGSGILVAGVGIMALVLAPREKIELSIEGTNIVWVDKTKTKEVNSKYYIFNGDFLVDKVEETQYALTDENLIDEVGPEKVKKVSIKYSDTQIYFTWEETVDGGTDNSIWINLYNNKDRQIAYSNAVNVNFKSGVYKYVVKFNGEEYDIWNKEFKVNMTDLDDGITVAKLYAIDNRGNVGEVADIPLYNYKVILSKENNLLKFRIDDNTQTYSYKAYIDDEDKGLIKDESELNDKLKDKNPPDSIKELDIKVNDRKANISWEDTMENGTSYKVKVEAFGETYYNSTLSDELEIEKKGTVKGYYYKINKESQYNITDKDDFTEKTDIDFTGEYGKYYIHIAAIDDSGNMSKTKTFNLEFKKPVVENNTNSDSTSNEAKPDDSKKPTTKPDNSSDELEEKINLINSLMKIVGNVSKENQNKAIDKISKIPIDILNSIKGYGINIYLINGEAEEIYENLTGEEILDITGVFIWGGEENAVICESAYMDSTLLHEMGHASDFALGKGDYISNSNKFTDIYEAEKDKLFKENEYVRDSINEYFAETFLMYYTKNYILRIEAPKTYAYLKALLE